MAEGRAFTLNLYKIFTQISPYALDKLRSSYYITNQALKRDSLTVLALSLKAPTSPLTPLSQKETMTVWVVIYEDWDTEGNASPTEIVGAYSSYELVPDRFKESGSSYQSYTVKEVKVDHTDSW